MHFGLTEEQDLLQESLRRFTAEKLSAQHLRTRFDEGTGFDEDLWQRAAEVGLPGLIVPEDFGGAGLEMLDLALAFEILGDGAVPGPFLGHALATIAISRGGSAAQKSKWLPRLATGEVVGGCAFAEKRGVWEPGDWSLALEDGRACGSKRFGEVGPHTDVSVVGLAGGRLGLIEKNAAGLRLETVDSVDRGRALAHLHLEDTPVDLLAADDGAAADVMDAARILLAADAFGAAWKLIRATVDYALAREQFSTPIAQFQAVKHQLAKMAMEAEPMRGLIWYAAYAFDHRRDEVAREAATAKAHITDRVVQIGREAVSLHGGIGFTWECDVHFWLKRAIHDRTWLGSPAAHRERLAALADW
ncbi:MAG: acyl-CoA/acyl-ACP dehydrogenase [bacterium]|nr:acyl-CoA/acyl-ACP dehydrogenase [bacterium]